MFAVAQGEFQTPAITTQTTSQCGLLVLRVRVVCENILLSLNWMYTSFPPSGPGKTQLISENISMALFVQKRQIKLKLPLISWITGKTQNVG